MNETIEFSYWFTDDHGNDEKRIVIRKSSENGVNGTDICDAFEDFMRSAGFCVEKIYEYFKE